MRAACPPTGTPRSRCVTSPPPLSLSCSDVFGSAVEQVARAAPLPPPSAEALAAAAAAAAAAGGGGGDDDMETDDAAAEAGGNKRVRMG